MDKLQEFARTVALRLFIEFKTLVFDEGKSPGSIWTNSRMAMASTLSFKDVEPLLLNDGRFLTLELPGTENFHIQMLLIWGSGDDRQKLRGILFLVQRQLDAIRPVVEKMQVRLRQPGAEGRIALFSTLSRRDSRILGPDAWPQGITSEPKLANLARQVLENKKTDLLQVRDQTTIEVGHAFRKLPLVLAGITQLPPVQMLAMKVAALAVGFILYSLIISRLLIGYLSEIFLRPIEQLMGGAQKVSGQDFSVSLNIATGDEFEHLSAEFNSMTRGLRERLMLERYVSSEVLEEVTGSESAELRPGGERRNASVLFAHIAGFSDLASTNPPDQIFQLLNEYMPLMENAISSAGGTIDKYIGDAIMAVFREPTLGHSQPERISPSAFRVCQAAGRMKKALALLNETRQEKGLVAIEQGIGIASGSVISGKIGSRLGRLDFTVIGDAVNLAARLESESRKQEQGSILVDAPTVAMAGEAFDFHALGPLQVKGKEKTVEVYRLSRVLADDGPLLKGDPAK